MKRLAGVCLIAGLAVEAGAETPDRDPLQAALATGLDAFRLEAAARGFERTGEGAGVAYLKGVLFGASGLFECWARTAPDQSPAFACAEAYESDSPHLTILNIPAGGIPERDQQ